MIVSFLLLCVKCISKTYVIFSLKLSMSVGDVSRYMYCTHLLI